MVLTIIIVLLSAIALYVLFVPILLIIDTRTNDYSLQLKGLFKASIHADEDEIIKIKMRLLAYTFYLFPLKSKQKSKPTKQIKAVKKKSVKNQIRFKRILRLIKSFKIKLFYLNLDTGDCITNAKLYPVFALLNFYKAGCHINFMGENTLVLVVENRPIRLLKSYVNIKN